MCLLAAGATGETMIEVDENGDEYELKRFYIQGRQLRGDGSQSQCVVTRRKRSGRGIQAGAVAPGSVSVSSQPLTVESLPAKEHREGGAVLQEVENSNRRFVALTGVHLESPVRQEEQHEAEENDDDDDEGNEGDEDEAEEQSAKSQSNYVPAALALPLQSQTTAAHLKQGVSVVANAASHANVGEDAGIVVVQSHQPPKVNPDTHAVFELKPVQPDVDHHHAAVSFYPFVQPWEVVDEHEDDYDEDDYDEEDYDDFYYGGNGYYRDQPGFHGLGAFEEEIITEDQPVTTIASWTTGEDDSDVRPAASKRPNQKNRNKNQKNKKNQHQRIQNQKNRRQQQKKRQEEAQAEEQAAKRKQKKPQPQQDKDQKNKQDKDQKKKKPEESADNQEVGQLTPVDVIKKPVAMEATSAVAASSATASTSGSNSSASNSTDQKKKKKKKPASSSSSSNLGQRKTKKKKKQSSSSSISSSSNSKRRRRPSSNMGSSSGSSGGSSSIGGYRRRRPQQQSQQQRRRKTQQQQQQQKRRRQQQQQQKRRRQQQQKRRRQQNRQFYGNEPIINCIYINKDPPTTTTPRPFWNLLGRQSEAETESSSKSAEPGAESSEESQVDPVAQQAVLQAVRRNFGDFGGRKRTNLRFVA
ncbi:uncharacterized protein LOC108021938 [Drosophila biarmipes]|uniref:uncharacterized protein LOC108021938 n=1 Tax=Drosophila biarmipes TaxID=125945 RepID=UPI0007E7B727|nr:uncharacterized protein LOC108021938 [Drosophila biarmipes]